MNRRTTQTGNATAEVIVAMLALAPFLVGIPLLGKQLDIKHKTYDATRYSVWERTIWSDHGSTNRKSANDINLEAQDRTLGHPKAGLLDVAQLRVQGITENPLWIDREQQRLLNYDGSNLPVSTAHTSEREPVRVGLALVPTMAYENGTVAAPARLTGLAPLGMSERAFARSELQVEVRAKLHQLASRAPSLRREGPTDARPAPLVHRATGAILSDTWAAADENNLGRLVDQLTINEALQFIEFPARVLGTFAIGRGEILYGEGQFGWDAEFRPDSTQLPRTYIYRPSR